MNETPWKSNNYPDYLLFFSFSDRMDPFTAMTDEEFVDRFRLRKESVHHLIEEIRDQLPPANDRRGKFILRF